MINKDGTVFHNDSAGHDWRLLWRHFADGRLGQYNDPVDLQYFNPRTEAATAKQPVTLHATEELRNVVLENVGANVRFNGDGTTRYDDEIDAQYVQWVRNMDGPSSFANLNPSANYRYPTSLLV